MREREGCVKRVFEEIEASHSQTEETSEGDSFVDIVGGLEKEVGGDSEWLTFADILQRADSLSETLLQGVVGVPYLPLR